MRKTLTTLMLAGAFVFTTATAFACPFGERSASYKHDQVASTMKSTADKKKNEAMSTFNPKNTLELEKIVDTPKKPFTTEEAVE